MAISLRLDKQLEERLELASDLAGISKSEYVRRCLEQALTMEENRPSAYELAKDLIPATGSGRGNLARDSEKIVKEIIREKASRRRFRSPGGAV